MADPAWPFGGVSADWIYLGIDLDQTDIGTGYLGYFRWNFYWYVLCDPWICTEYENPQ